MTSDTVAVTNPLASGIATSEGKMTLFSVVMGFVLAIFGALQPALDNARTAHPDSKWVAIACLVVGGVISVASLFGYNKGRALLKSTQVAGMLQSGIPVVVDLVTAAFAKSQLVKQVPVATPSSTSSVLSDPLRTPTVPPPTVRP